MCHQQQAVASLPLCFAAGLPQAQRGGPSPSGAFHLGQEGQSGQCWSTGLRKDRPVRVEPSSPFLPSPGQDTQGHNEPSPRSPHLTVYTQGSQSA